MSTKKCLFLDKKVCEFFFAVKPFFLSSMQIFQTWLYSIKKMKEVEEIAENKKCSWQYI